MAEPKKKRSKTRTRRARANQNFRSMMLVACKKCGAQIRSHIVCHHCGYYRGIKVM